MYPYLGSYTKIAVIFGITHTRVRKAVLNDYVPPDDETEDYVRSPSLAFAVAIILTYD
jgi:hypothetical protein